MHDKLHAKLFEPTASTAQQAVALIFDLEGFSRFYSQPDVNRYVPMYVNHVLNAMNTIITGGEVFWDGTDEEFVPIVTPTHWKYLGDGGLYVWQMNEFSEEKIISLFNGLWNLKNNFKRVVQRAMEEVPVLDLPKNIRFGLAAGTVYRLTYNNSKTHEYIGYCINLASRLESYCKGLGFIASARVPIPLKVLEENRYMRVVATQLKGFPQEIVIVDQSEFEALDKEERESLFATLD